METIVPKAIQSVLDCKLSFCKFITANDIGSTGSHQAGFYIPKNSWSLFFDMPGEKGSNKDKFIKIKWQDDFDTESRITYYGSGTRNEYRITRFGRNFPFLDEDSLGDLLVLCKIDDSEFSGYVLKTEDETEDFFAACNIDALNTNTIIPKSLEPTSEEKLLKCFSLFIKTIDKEFPATAEMAEQARKCYNTSYQITEAIIKNNPNQHILNWLNAEFELFKMVENKICSSEISKPFDSVQDFVDTANSILNRRKSRAGSSLENHLRQIFMVYNLSFETQKTTEGKKKPDFIFPNISSYKDLKFDKKKLTMLASKTTCKDRWRQILTEADRIKDKHLFTLQQGISKNQLKEMYSSGVRLVVPRNYINTYPAEYRDKILSLDTFISATKHLEKI